MALNLQCGWCGGNPCRCSKPPVTEQTKVVPRECPADALRFLALQPDEYGALHLTPADARAILAKLATPAPVQGSGGEAIGSGDLYDSTKLPELHPDPAINAEILLDALCARLNIARQALADTAAMQVVQPELAKIKANAAWAMEESKPSRVLPRSAKWATPPSPGSEGVEGAGEPTHGSEAVARLVDFANNLPRKVDAPGSEGADPIHNAADSTDDSAGHVKGAGEQAGEVERDPADEVLARLHTLARQINDDEMGDHYLNLSAEMLTLLQAARWGRNRLPDLVPASALAQARAECEHARRDGEQAARKVYSGWLAQARAENKRLRTHANSLHEQVKGRREKAERLREGLREARRVTGILKTMLWGGATPKGDGADGETYRLVAALDARIDTLLASGGEGGSHG